MRRLRACSCVDDRVAVPHAVHFSKRVKTDKYARNRALFGAPFLTPARCRSSCSHTLQMREARPVLFFNRAVNKVSPCTRQAVIFLPPQSAESITLPRVISAVRHQFAAQILWFGSGVAGGQIATTGSGIGIGRSHFYRLRGCCSRLRTAGYSTAIPATLTNCCS